MVHENLSSKKLAVRESLSNAWFCTVGPTVRLQSPPEGSILYFPITLGVFTNDGAAGYVNAARIDDIIHIDMILSGNVSSSQQLEALRLFSRIAMRIGKNEHPVEMQFRPTNQKEKDLLASDGFELTQHGTYFLKPKKFVRPLHNKAHSMKEVYEDPFSIPWNFVPVESDLLKHVIEIDGLDELQILDIGCGYGKNALFLAQFGIDVHGIDIAPQAISRCKNIVPSPENFTAGTVTDLNWPDNTFNLIIDVGCLHCLPENERRQAVEEIARVLKPNGLMVSRLFKPKNETWLADQPFETSKFGFTHDAIREMLYPRFSFKVLEENDWAFYTMAQLINQLL